MTNDQTITKSQISISKFAEVEMRVGLVVEAINKEGSEKLIRLTVSFADETRIIFTGVRTFGFVPENFVNKKFLFVTNLEYRKMMDEESQGMILAVDGPEGKPVFVEVPDLLVGAKVR